MAKQFWQRSIFIACALMRDHLKLHYALCSSSGISDLRGSMERKEQSYPGAANRHSSSVARASTHISTGIKIKGVIVADEDLHIDGYVEGSLSAGGHRVTLGEMAFIRAETVAREMVVYGAFQGNLRAHDRIEIKKNASVEGGMATAKMVIEEGAHIKGSIDVDGNAQVGADLGTLLARSETKD
jgi:cytoskeletal protein CcmA (bactofilin family)